MVRVLKYWNRMWRHTNSGFPCDFGIQQHRFHERDNNIHLPIRSMLFIAFETTAVVGARAGSSRKKIAPTLDE